MAGHFEFDFKTVFPNLIIFLGPNKNERLFNQLKKSFNEFQYGPLSLQEYKHESGGRLVSTCRIIQHTPENRCLAEGEGNLPCDAEEKAVTMLMEKLYDSFYVIQANPEYFTKKNVPPFALYADPKQRHIYKVVFLKNNSRRSNFPKSVSGAVDYVEDYNELLKYIEDHGKSDSKADLFILNVLKTDRAQIRDQCQKNQLNIQFLVGCSDMGIFAFRNMSTRDILQQLLTVGGETVKYKLVGPRDRFGSNNIKIKEEEPRVENKDVTEEGEEVVISPWIADRLIIMERVTQWNELESDKEILFCSVRDCPDTENFIIEKKRTNTAMIHAEALVDTTVVGKARGFKEKEVKLAAAADAMKNLTNSCYYIRLKRTYYGSSSLIPVFLRYPDYPSSTELYRIAEYMDVRHPQALTKMLKQFRKSPQEDLYFLLNYTEEERNIIHNCAVSMNFLVRWIGREGLLCVYKMRKPRELFMKLMDSVGKENEKYKLFIPHSKMYPREEVRATQSWNNQGIQANQSIGGGQGMEQQQVPRSSGSASQSCSSGTGSSAQKQNDPPSWVMNFIKSAPIKQGNKSGHKFDPYNIVRPFGENERFHSKGKVIRLPEGNGNDIYKRYKFVAPVKDPPDVSTSEMNVQRVKETPSESLNKVKPGNTTTEKNLTPTLSERLEKILKEKSGEAYVQGETNLEENKPMASDRSFVNNTSVTGSSGNKRPCDQEIGVKEEGGSINKFSKLTTNSQMPELRNSNEKQNFKDQSRPEYYSEDNFSTRMFDTPGHSLQRSNFKAESTIVKTEEETFMNTPQLYRRQEATHNQYNNPLWVGKIKEQYDQRPNALTGGQQQHNFSHLFDGVDSQGPSYEIPLGTAASWRRNRSFKKGGSSNTNFSKMEKYGRKHY